MRHRTPEIQSDMRQSMRNAQAIERLLWITIVLLIMPTLFMAGRLYERQISKTVQQSTPAW